MVNIGIADLGLSRAEVLGMSPVQFTELRDRVEAQDRPRGKVLEILIAQLTAIVVNTGFRGFAEPQTTRDFMLSREQGKAERKPRRAKQVRQEVADNWAMGMRQMMEKRNG